MNNTDLVQYIFRQSNILYDAVFVTLGELLRQNKKFKCQPVYMRFITQRMNLLTIQLHD